MGASARGRISQLPCGASFSVLSLHRTVREGVVILTGSLQRLRFLVQVLAFRREFGRDIASGSLAMRRLYTSDYSRPEFVQTLLEETLNGRSVPLTVAGVVGFLSQDVFLFLFLFLFLLSLLRRCESETLCGSDSVSYTSR